jgi:hypothetical protein
MSLENIPVVCSIMKLFSEDQEMGEIAPAPENARKNFLGTWS